MRLTLPLPCLLVVFSSLAAQEAVRFDQYIAGQKLGGSESLRSAKDGAERIESREWLTLNRLGMDTKQEIRQTAMRRPDGSQHFTWRVQLSAEPFEGEADWSPKTPRILRVRAKGSAAREVTVPEGALLWPGDTKTRLREAARLRQPVRVVSFSFPTQQWTELDLAAPKAAPLPGYGDAMRFEGTGAEGPARMEVQVWVSPAHGDLRHITHFSGLEILSQRIGLPAPTTQTPGNFFDATLKTLPFHPLLAWLPEVTVRWSGKGRPALPQDGQQVQLEPGRYRLRRPAPLTPEEALDPPVIGTPTREDLPFLAPTSLVQFQDPDFEGLIQRLRPPRGASRWDLAKRVNAFVYDWIDRKDFTVGFASALEVCHTPQGDCTEHGVLAVALLRKLGVPARGVAGWVALDKTLGLHFWVEVKVKDRWIPIDPTFDQAPASAFRLKLGTTDLADLGSLGWDNAAQAFAEGAWSPEGPWTQSLLPAGDTLTGPNGLRLRYPGGRWSLRDGQLLLNDRWQVKAWGRPAGEDRQTAKALTLGPRTAYWTPGPTAEGRRGNPKAWIEAAEGQWLEIGPVSELEAHRLLEGLEIHLPQ